MLTTSTGAIRRSLVALVCALPITACPAAAEPRPAPTAAQAIETATKTSRDWKRLTTPDLTVVGNASERDLRRALKEIQDFRAALAALFPGLKMAARTPTLLVVLKDEMSFRKFRPRDEKGRRRENVAGFFTAAPHANYMVLGTYGDRALTFEVIFHEYTHFIIRENFHEVPLWVNEGLADFYSTFRSNYKDGRSLVGAAPTGRLSSLWGGTRLPLQRILTSEGAASLYRDPARTFAFYAHSWALVHYLQLGNNSARAGQLPAYLHALNQGLSIERAFDAAFHTTFDGMGKELDTYLRQTGLPGLLIDPGAPHGDQAGEPVVVPLRETDAAFIQGDILALVGATEDAENILSRALTLDPTHTEARIAMARVRGQQDREEEGIQALQAVAAAEPGRFSAQLYLADALRGAKRYQEAVLAAERAVAIEPESTHAWYGLNLSALAAGRESQAEAAFARLIKQDGDPSWHRSRTYDAYALGLDEAVLRSAQAFIDAAGWGNESSPYVAYAGALAGMRLRRQAEAAILLEKASLSVRLGSWQDLLATYLAGQLATDQIIAKAGNDGERTEARAYAGMLDLIAGRREEGLRQLRWVRERGLKSYVEYRMAVATLARLEEEQPSAK